MARKATDLLDVFRFSSEGGGGRKPPRKRSRGGGQEGEGGKKRTRPKRRFEGVFLNARQLLLASSALVLLLVLSFVIGLATGKPGDEGGTATLDRTTLLAIQARLPVVDPATRRSVRPAQIEKRLRQDYDIEAENIRIRRDGSELIIEVGPFRSEAQARRYIQRAQLDMAHIHMENPFRFVEFVPWRRGK